MDNVSTKRIQLQKILSISMEEFQNLPQFDDFTTLSIEIYIPLPQGVLESDEFQFYFFRRKLEKLEAEINEANLKAYSIYKDQRESKYSLHSKSAQLEILKRYDEIEAWRLCFLDQLYSKQPLVFELIPVSQLSSQPVITDQHDEQLVQRGKKVRQELIRSQLAAKREAERVNAFAACSAQRARIQSERLAQEVALAQEKQEADRLASIATRHAEFLARIDKIEADFLIRYAERQAKEADQLAAIAKQEADRLQWRADSDARRAKITDLGAQLTAQLTEVIAAVSALIRKSQAVSNPLVSEQPSVLTSPSTSSLQPQESFTKHSPSDAPSVKTYLEVVASNTSTTYLKSSDVSSIDISPSNIVTSAKTEIEDSTIIIAPSLSPS